MPVVSVVESRFVEVLVETAEDAIALGRVYTDDMLGEMRSHVEGLSARIRMCDHDRMVHEFGLVLGLDIMAMNGTEPDEGGLMLV
jgi:hypothetical protein